MHPFGHVLIRNQNCCSTISTEPVSSIYHFYLGTRVKSSPNRRAPLISMFEKVHSAVLASERTIQSMVAGGHSLELSYSRLLSFPLALCSSPRQLYSASSLGSIWLYGLETWEKASLASFFIAMDVSIWVLICAQYKLPAVSLSILFYTVIYTWIYGFRLRITLLTALFKPGMLRKAATVHTKCWYPELQKPNSYQHTNDRAN